MHPFLAAELVLPPALQGLCLTALGAVGAVFGSFLNVVVWRVPRGESIVWPGSHCPHCGAPIRAEDNIPILSWLLLRARCRSCRGRISARYPLVEGLAAAVSVALGLHDGFTALLPFHLAYVYGLIALSLIDLDTWLLPFSISIPLIPLGIASAWLDPNRIPLQALLGAGIGWSLIVVVGKLGEIAFKKEAMGGGDAWLLAGIGAFTGPTLLVVALFLASVQGAIIGGLMIALRRDAVPDASAKAEEDWVPDPHAIPFGPFLALAGVECLFFGAQMLELLHRHFAPFLPG